MHPSWFQFLVNSRPCRFSSNVFCNGCCSIVVATTRMLVCIFRVHLSLYLTFNIDAICCASYYYRVVFQLADWFYGMAAIMFHQIRGGQFASNTTQLGKICLDILKSNQCSGFYRLLSEELNQALNQPAYHVVCTSSIKKPFIFAHTLQLRQHF